MTTLSKGLREALAEQFTIARPAIAGELAKATMAITAMNRMNMVIDVWLRDGPFAMAHK